MLGAFFFRCALYAVGLLYRTISPSGEFDLASVLAPDGSELRDLLVEDFGFPFYQTLLTLTLIPIGWLIGAILIARYPRFAKVASIIFAVSVAFWLLGFVLEVDAAFDTSDPWGKGGRGM